MIDWSHDLLTAQERALFRRFAVFAGGFTLEAAETVGAGGEVHAIDVLHLLTELVEKSLVVVDAGAERYRLLDTVREYAQERLDQSGESDPVRARHLAFYLALAEEVEPKLRGTEQNEWLKRLDFERENFLAAHASCNHVEGAAEQGLRLIFALVDYWIHQPLVELGHRLMVEALARAPARQRSLARCPGLTAAALLVHLMGRHAEAVEYLEEAVSIARALRDEGSLAVALRLLGVMAYSQGKHAEARRHLEDALPVAPEAAESGRRYRRGVSGDPSPGRGPGCGRSSVGGKRGVCSGVGFFHGYRLAALSISRGLGERARRMLLEAIGIAENCGTNFLGQGVVEAAAGLAAHFGEWRRAAQLYGAADVLCEQIGLKREPVDEMFLAPLIARAREALGPAAFATAEAAGRTLSHDVALVEIRAWLKETGAMAGRDGIEPARNKLSQ